MVYFVTTVFILLSKPQIHHFLLPLHAPRAMHTVLICLSVSIYVRFVSTVFVTVVVSGNASIIYSGFRVVRKKALY